jgi:ribonuclease BN (tRNA processing enzyme)
LNTQSITFWGTRGSTPTPDKNKLEFGGDTSCIEFRSSDNEIVVFDMGSGLRRFGQYLLNDKTTPKNIHFLISHYHWDHLIGFLAFSPIFDASYTFTSHGKNEKLPLPKLTERLLDKSFWPVNLKMILAKLIFLEIKENEFTIGDNIKVMVASHGHPNGATGYRLECNGLSIVYITDCEHPVNDVNPNVVNLSKDADVLIHDSHFSPDEIDDHVGWGHSSYVQATQVAIQANVKQLVLFHHNPNHDDKKVAQLEKEAQKLFPNTISARQDMVLEFPSNT